MMLRFGQRRRAAVGVMLVALVGLTGTATACSDDGPAGSADGGPDAAEMDGGDTDGGPADAGPPDAATDDAGDMDAGELDAGDMDGGPDDAGDMDGGPADAGDSGPADASDSGPDDAGDSGPDDAGALTNASDAFLMECYARCEKQVTCAPSVGTLEECQTSCDAEQTRRLMAVDTGTPESEVIACFEAKQDLDACLVSQTCDAFIEYYTRPTSDYPCKTEDLAMESACASS